MAKLVEKTETPWWLKRALLGTCFWIGHRRSLYRGYPLGESAMVAELCNILFANLPSGLKLLCEVQYSNLFAKVEASKDVVKKSRVDLCVCGPLVKGQEPLEKVKYVFEVKRGSASAAAIDDDLRRLLTVRKALPHVKTFLILVSEGKRPARFVSEKSYAVRKKLPIPKSDGHCCVRAVMKAVQAMKSIDHAHYACAIEVLHDDT